MSNKLTDAEVKKALETLEKLDFFYGQRAGRELWNEKPVDVQNEDIKNFSKDIEFLKDLINRKEEEKQNLEIELQAMRGAANSFKAEVERLQNAYKQCAWERDIFAEDMKEEIKKDCSYLMLDIKTIKAEAYKEFAEKIKEKTKWLFSSVSINNEVDNLLNELVGDIKEKKEK